MLPKRRIKHRVVCICKAAGCCDGQYIDANGRTQHGVEVFAETKEAHERAKQRLALQSTTSLLLDGPSRELPNNLILKLMGFSLDSTSSVPSPLTSTSTQATTACRDGNSIQPEIDRNTPVPRSTIPTACKPLDRVSRMCPAAMSAKNNGHRPFDCGLFVLR